MSDDVGWSWKAGPEGSSFLGGGSSISIFLQFDVECWRAICLLTFSFDVFSGRGYCRPSCHEIAGTTMSAVVRVACADKPGVAHACRDSLIMHESERRTLGRRGGMLRMMPADASRDYPSLRSCHLRGRLRYCILQMHSPCTACTRNASAKQSDCNTPLVWCYPEDDDNAIGFCLYVCLSVLLCVCAATG